MVTHTHTTDVIESVVSYMMSPFHNHPVYVRMLADIIAHYKESGFNPVLVQYVQKPWGNFGYRSVIKGKIYRMFIRIFPEYALGVYM